MLSLLKYRINCYSLKKLNNGLSEKIKKVPLHLPFLEQDIVLDVGYCNIIIL